MRLAATLTAALLTLSACTSEASSPVGTYAVMIDTTGMPADAAEMMTQMMTFNDMHLLADGTWDASSEMDMLGQKQTSTVKGTWEMVGDEIVMTATEEDGEVKAEPQVQRGKHANGTITLEMTDDASGQTMKLIMTKK